MAELDVSTKLAFARTCAAYDRTMMAWIRTATSLISFGFAIFKFFQLELGTGRQDGRLVGAREFAIIMVGIGLAIAVDGWRGIPAEHAVAEGAESRSASFPNRHACGLDLHPGNSGPHPGSSEEIKRQVSYRPPAILVKKQMAVLIYRTNTPFSVEQEDSGYELDPHLLVDRETAALITAKVKCAVESGVVVQRDRRKGNGHAVRTVGG